MRFDRLRARGLGPFMDEIDVDFSGIAGKLVAITGANGSGKSSLLGLLAGALYRDCPTRGSLVDLANARDAYLDVSFVNGAPHRAKHLIDSVSGKSEAIVMDADGRPLTADAKVRTFDGWMAKHVPTKDVLLASTFSAQASGGFLEMRAGERKQVLLMALGIEKLEAIAERAREHARETKQAVSVLDARITDARSRAGDPDAVAAELDALKAQHAEYEVKLIAAKQAHDAALAAEQVARLARKEADEYLARRAGIVAKIQRVTTERTDIERRMGNNRGVLDRGEEIRKAVARAKELDALRESQAAEVTALRTAVTAAENDVAMADQELASLDAAKVRAEGIVARARHQLADRGKVEAAQAALPTLTNSIATWETKLAELRAELEAANEFRLNGATTRIKDLRGALEDISWDRDATDLGARADKALMEDDKASERAASAPETIRDLKARLATAEATLAEQRTLLAAAERLAARATEIANAEKELSAANGEVFFMEEAAAEAAARRVAAAERSADVATKLRAAALRERETTTERAPLDALLKFAEPLAQAQARLDELAPTHERMGAEIKALTAELDELGDMPETPPIPDLTGVRLALADAERAFRGVDAAIAVKEAQLTSAKAAAEQLAGLEAERRAADEDLADWTRLADELGRDGIQSLELDAAGPEITAITNDLLHEAFGPRFTVRFDTVKRSADGKRDLEAFDISVLDTEKAREGTAETYSGGERVILSEAIGLAISTIACRRTGSEDASLIRDESGAALDEHNARAYVQMLRRGADLIGASQVLLVSHSPAVWALCDAQLVVENGAVRIAS